MIHPERCISMKTSQAIRLPQVSITENVLKCNNFFAFWHILHTSLLRFSLIPVFFPQQLLCLCFCHLLRRHKFLISEHKTEMPYSRSHACLPCDLLCAHIAALRSKKSVSIPPCGKCSVNLSRLQQLSGHKFFFMTPRHKIYWQIFIKNLSSDFCIQKNMRYLMYACF